MHEIINLNLIIINISKKFVINKQQNICKTTLNISFKATKNKLVVRDLDNLYKILTSNFNTIDVLEKKIKY